MARVREGFFYCCRLLYHRMNYNKRCTVLLYLAENSFITFALWRLGILVLLIIVKIIICWASWIWQAQSTGLQSVFLKHSLAPPRHCNSRNFDFYFSKTCQNKKEDMKSHWYMYLPTSSLSFFLVHRAKRSRHANDDAGYLRCETGEASRAAALVSRARALPLNTKYEEKERLLAVYICRCTNLHSLVCMVYLSWASESNFVNFHVFCNCHSCCWSISWYQVYNTWWKTSLENTHRHKNTIASLWLW